MSYIWPLLLAILVLHILVENIIFCMRRRGGLRG